MSQPARARRLRQLVMLLLCLWLVVSMVSLFWALVPAADTELPEDIEIVNPVRQATGGPERAPVDVAQLQSRH